MIRWFDTLPTRTLLAISAASLIALLAIQCASIPVRQQAAVAAQSLEQSLAVAQDAEHQLCDPTVPVMTPVTHCAGPAATAIGLTDLRHQAFSRALSTAFQAQIDLVRVLTATATSALPSPTPSLASLLAQANAALAVVQALAPASNTGVTTLVADVQAILASVTSIQKTLAGS